MGRTPQLELFGEPWAPKTASPPQAATPSEALRALGERLPKEVRLGTSSWSFPGWTGLIYAEAESQVQLARAGLPAYAQHPLLRTVGIDRTFYGPVLPEVFRGWQTPSLPGFAFSPKLTRSSPS